MSHAVLQVLHNMSYAPQGAPVRPGGVACFGLQPRARATAPPVEPNAPEASAFGGGEHRGLMALVPQQLTVKS